MFEKLISDYHVVHHRDMQQSPSIVISHFFFLVFLRLFQFSLIPTYLSMKLPAKQLAPAL